MSAGVEWALHCGVLLAVLKPTGTLHGRRTTERSSAIETEVPSF